MKRINIDKSDKYRVLLTEVLPYETALFFSNEGFYRFCRSHFKDAPLIIKRILAGWKSDQAPKLGRLNTIPYLYQIRKGTIETRTIGVMHPSVQMQFSDLYEQFAHVIISLCQRSSFSLRHPVAIGSAFYWQDFDGETADDELRYSSHYFDYKKYDFLYKFFESYEFHRLEKRFRHLWSFDISKCFNHIYTHTLSWAVRGKSFAKAQIGRRTFDNLFDEIMQSANHRETAGILIGPEASRLFAEIILQRVDSSVAERLKKEGLKQGIDFEVRRYIDDYYLFSRSSDMGKEIMQVYHQELSTYRLYLNEAKSTESLVPFMTRISCAKLELRNILNEFFEKLSAPALEQDKDQGVPAFRKPRVEANHFIQEIKAAVFRHSIEYSSATGFLFGVAEKRIASILKSLPKDPTKDKIARDILYTFLDVMFFVYAMDVRVSTTYKIARLSLSILNSIDGLQDETVEQIKKKIHDESIRILTTEIRQQGELDLYVETLNLLVVFRRLGPDYALGPKILDDILQKLEGKTTDDSEDVHIQYFLVVALLFYMGDDTRYAAQKIRLLEMVTSFLDTVPEPFQRADCTCLFFDILSCPYVDGVYKRQIVKSVRLDGRLLSSKERIDLLDIVPMHQWFTDWQARDSIEILLEKKRYRTPY